MRKSNAYYQGNQIAVAPDGTLYNVTAVLYTGAGIQPNLNGVYMGVMRSNDAGRTWTGPVHIAPIRTAQLFVPDDHFPIRAEDYLPDIAISPINGDIYVVWSDGLGTAIDKVVHVQVQRRRPPLQRPDRSSPPADQTSSPTTTPSTSPTTAPSC